MKAHTSDFKNKIKEFGRQLDSKITYTLNGQEVELGGEQLNSITPHYQGAILKSVMKQLDIDSNVEIPVGTEVNYQFGVLIGNSYEYIDFGNYIVKDIEKQEDTYSYKITCYDKMLYSMKDYEAMNITYPITIRNYISAICTHLGLTFKNASDTFANYDKEIPSELYLDSNGNSLDYTFRDVLDQLAEVTASTICINEDDDELEIRYVNQTIGKNKIDKDNLVMMAKDNISYSIIDTGIRTILTKAGTWRFVCFKIGLTSELAGKTIRLKSSFTSSGTNLGRYYLGYCDQNGENRTIVITSNTSDRTISMTVETGIQDNVFFGLYANTNSTTSAVGDYVDYTNLIVTADDEDMTYEPYGDTIDEEYLKDINVNFGEKFGAVNTIVLSRSAGADNIYYPSTLPENPVEIKISDNLIMNGNDRDTFMPDIYNKLNGLEYYINDFSSTGVCYYDLCDKYNVKIGDNFYSCIMFNDEVDVTQGLEEHIYTDLPEESVTDYKKADKTDRKINQTTLIVDKQNQQIQALITNVEENSEKIDALEPTQQAIGIEELEMPNSAGKDLIEFRLKGKSAQNLQPTPSNPQDINSIGDVRNLFDKDNANILNAYINTTNKTVMSNNNTRTIYIPCKSNTTYTISRISGQRFVVDSFSQIPANGVVGTNQVYNQTASELTITTGANDIYLAVFFYISTADILTEQEILDSIQIEKSSIKTEYIPYGNYIDVVNRGKNLWGGFNYSTTNAGISFSYNEDGSIKAEGISIATAFSITVANALANGVYKSLRPGTYTVSSDNLSSSVGIQIYDSNSVLIGYSSTESVTFTLTEATIIIIRIRITSATTINETFHIQLEESLEETSYEPYTAIHNYINLTQPLPSLPDGTADELIIKDGRAKIVQNVGRVVLNGSEDWAKHGSIASWFYYDGITNGYLDNTSSNTAKSNYYKQQPYNSVTRLANGEFAYGTSSGTTKRLVIKNTDYNNASDFKNWLSTHNTLIYYVLAEPTEIDLGEVLIKTINGDDYLYITDPIKSDMYAKYIRQSDISDLYYTKTETDTQINMVKGEIDLAVDRIDDLTPFIDSKTGTNYLHLEKTFSSEGAINKLSIKGFTLSPLYPGMSYPSDTQYPGANNCYKLYFDTVYPISITKKTIEIISPIPLQTATINGEKVEDELLIENNKVSIIQNLGYNTLNQLVKLNESIIHEVGELPIPTLPYDTYITVENYNNDTLSFECEYLQANPYTDIFATQSEMSAKLSITEDNINSKVSKNNLVSEINQSAEEIRITGNRFVVESDNFKLSADGTIESTNGVFGGTVNTNEDLTVGNNVYIGQNQSESNIDSKYLYFSDNTHIMRRRILNTEGLLLQSDFVNVYANQFSVYDNTVGNMQVFRTSDNETQITNTSNGLILLRNTDVYLSSNPIITSDKRLKQKIKDIDTSFIDDLKIKEFEYKNTPNKKQIGLIAQDYIDKEYSKYFLNNSINPNDNQEYYSIAYGNITNALIQYCQELKKEINDLKERLDNYEKN